MGGLPIHRNHTLHIHLARCMGGIWFKEHRQADNGQRREKRPRIQTATCQSPSTRSLSTDSLDPDSTNPVQNGAIASKVAELEAGTLFGVDTEENDDGSTTVRLNSKTSTIAEFTVKGGGGGGGDEASLTKIVLSASVDKKTIKEGDSALLTRGSTTISIPAATTKDRVPGKRPPSESRCAEAPS